MKVIQLLYTMMNNYLKGSRSKSTTCVKVTWNSIRQEPHRCTIMWNAGELGTGMYFPVQSGLVATRLEEDGQVAGAWTT